ncbi:MAG: DUF4340 domain-containing protein [Treponema sp.]|jgi:hypothetical protein|nr:DUF4340 domain-containing protein [Treponema sp.]
MTYNKKLTILSGLIGILAMVYGGTLIFDPERMNARDAVFAWLDAKSVPHVSGIEISNSNGKINLVKKDEAWFVETDGREYTAKDARVLDLLNLLSKKDAYPVRGRESASFERLGLTEDKANRLIIRGGDAVFLDMFVGNEATTGQIYLRKNGLNEARTSADSLDLYVAGSKISWYNLRLFPETEKLTIDFVQALDVTLPPIDEEKTPPPIMLARVEGGWTVNGEKVDAAKAESYIHGVLDAEGEDFAAEPFLIGSAEGKIVIQLGNGTNRVVSVGALSDANKRDAVVSGSDYVYILSKWTLDRLFRSADSFK